MVDSQQIQILLVASNDHGAHWLRSGFEKTGLINVAQVVPDGPSALEWLRGLSPLATAPSPSLILLDLCREGDADLSTDLEVLAELKSDEAIRSIPVVVVTNSTAQSDILNAYSQGACSFVSRPESIKEQEQLLRRFASYWSQVALLPRIDQSPVSPISVASDDSIERLVDVRVPPVEILIVDDSEDDVVLLQEAFADCSLVSFIEAIDDGEQALKYLRREAPFANARRPGLVLLDINMPKKNGFEVLAEMRADPRLSNVPVVMLTTSKQESDILRAYANGACSFISKPVSFDRMRRIAEQFALYWTLVSGVPSADSALAG